ncbi:polyphosphate kinase 2 family protein [Myxococcota bacterium]|nr:polyphosphate kinase 2 family protein [Myxococcota bacterium]
MLPFPDSRWLVPFDDSFRHDRAPTEPPPGSPDEQALEEELERLTERLEKLQRRFRADGRRALLVIVQALDAAGKDGTIRAVLRGLDPAGCQVTSFGVPSKEELDHDFLWRCVHHLPPRGVIGVFNRSWYEEVLAVRVHPQFLGPQRIEVPEDPEELWAWRLQAIREQELHLSRSGTLVLKLWLKVGKEEQRKRLLARLEDPDRNWKFNARDVEERKHWDDYHEAFEQALRATSRPWAPWYCVPADDKDYMRVQVARLLVDALELLDPRYPDLDDAERAERSALRKALRA